MATYVGGASLAFAYNAANGTTGSFSPSGSDIALFAGVSSIEFGSKTINGCNYGGSGGTALTRIGSDLSWNSTACLSALFYAVGVPAASTDLYAGWAAAYLQSCIGGAAYSGVDQTTPYAGQVDNSGLTISVSTVLASVTVTGCTPGETIVAIAQGHSDTVSLSAFSAVSGTTLRSSDVTGTYLGVAVLEKVATGSSETLEVNVNSSSPSTLSWAVRGFRVNDAAGGGGAALTGVTSTQAVGTTGVAHTQAITGGDSTGAPGAVAVSHTQSLSGNASASAVGAVTSSRTVALTGNAATGSAGNVSAGGDITLALSGVPAVGGVGALGPENTRTVAGLVSTSGLGSVADSLVVGLAGVSGSGTVGSVAFVGDVTVALSGVQSAGYAGNVSPPAPLFIYDGHDGGKEPKKKAPDFKQYKEAKARLRKQIESSFTSEEPGEVKEVKAQAEKVLAQTISKQDIAAALETIKLLESALESAQDEEDLLNILL